MEKIVTEVYLPAAGQSFDVRIPLDISMYEAADIVGKLLGELAEGYFKPSGDEILCDRETGRMFDGSRTPAELGIAEGARLMLL